MVTAISSGGYQVRRFTREDIIDAIELRGIIEGAAALTAERGAPPVRLNALAEVVRKLDAVIAVYPGPMDFERYAAPNEQFHRMLVALSGSALIAREAERVTSLPFASPNAFVGAELNVPAFQQSLLVAQVQHRMMVQAIAREHAHVARQNLDFVLEEQPDLRRKVLALALMSGWHSRSRAWRSKTHFQTLSGRKDMLSRQTWRIYQFRHDP